MLILLKKSRSDLFCFFAWVLFLSSIVEGLIIYFENAKGSGGIFQESQKLVILLMWIPTISAFLSFGKKSFSDKFNHFLKRSYLGVLIPFVVCIILVAISLIQDVTILEILRSNWTRLILNSTPMNIYLIGYFIVSSAGEEIGWRGFMYPALRKKISQRKASLITGLVWGMWHAPVIIFTNYSAVNSPVLSSLIFFLLTISISFLMGEMWEKGCGLASFVLLHAFHNFSFYILLGGVERLGNKSLFFSEFGIVPPVIYCMIYLGFSRFGEDYTKGKLVA